MERITEISKAVDILKSGGILAHPADTCFGLTGDLMNPEALKKIQAIKGREASKPMSIMIPKVGSGQWSVSSKKNSPLPTSHYPLEDYVELSAYAKKVCDKLLPGAVTIVLPKGPKIPSWYFPETQWIGIRMVDDDNVNQLLDAFGGPLITTSANLSGEPTCYHPEEVFEIFKDRKHQPDGILMQEILEKKMPSTIIKIEGEKIEVLREGPIKISEMMF